MFCARRDGRRVSYGFRDNGVDRVDPILRARHRFSGARSAQALADLNRATLFGSIQADKVGGAAAGGPRRRGARGVGLS